LNKENDSAKKNIDSVCKGECENEQKKSEAEKKLDAAGKGDKSWFEKFKTALVSF